jgi:hypothetical protein
MNRSQRRAVSKDHERIDVSGIVVHFANGQYVNLDTNKVQVIDKETGRPLFDQVLEATTPKAEFASEPDKQSYTVEFDTPEGKMIYVKEGDWSGVKPA